MSRSKSFNLDVPELHWNTFRLQADVASTRICVRRQANDLAIYHSGNTSFLGVDLVRVPLTGRIGCEMDHFTTLEGGSAYRKDAAHMVIEALALYRLRPDLVVLAIDQ